MFSRTHCCLWLRALVRAGLIDDAFVQLRGLAHGDGLGSDATLVVIVLRGLLEGLNPSPEGVFEKVKSLYEDDLIPKTPDTDLLMLEVLIPGIYENKVWQGPFLSGNPCVDVVRLAISARATAASPASVLRDFDTKLQGSNV